MSGQKCVLRLRLSIKLLYGAGVANDIRIRGFLEQRQFVDAAAAAEVGDRV